MVEFGTKNIFARRVCYNDDNSVRFAEKLERAVLCAPQARSRSRCGNPKAMPCGRVRGGGCLMPVIKDVALRAGVSIGTVSKYFNHPDQLKPSTRERVRQAVEALGYRPNPIARSMRTGKTRLVAVMVPEVANPFYAEGFNALSGCLVSAGYLPLLITTNDNPNVSDPDEMAPIVAQTDAIVLYLLDASLNDALLPVLQNEKPTLLVTQRENPMAQCSIVIEEEDGMAAVGRHLLSIGRRRIAFVGGPADDSMTDSKYSGFMASLSLQGVRPLPPIRCEGFSPKMGYLAAERLMADVADERRPDAICCANDALAMGVLKYLLQSGLSVPEDVAVSGYDDLMLSRITVPALTTVRLPLDEVAHVALRFLQADAQHPFRTERLLASLTVRGSTVAGWVGEAWA